MWGQGNLYIMLNALVFWCFRREMLRVLLRPWRNMNPRLPRWSERVEEEFKESRQWIWYLEISVKSQVRSIWILRYQKTKVLDGGVIWWFNVPSTVCQLWYIGWSRLKYEHLSYKKLLVWINYLQGVFVMDI